jgi:UDP:flavonoid glycosyltransferase YjiC (YdhE family)
MATILLTWELGGGLGHLMNLRPIATELPRRGHRVFAALRDLSLAHRVLGESGVVFLQAPFKHQHMHEIQPCCTFAHILHNIGFSDVDELGTMLCAWKQLLDVVQPDLIVFDHSPTALLAARGVAARKALIGTGFFAPPNISPLPNLRTWLAVDRIQLQADESRVLATINAALQHVGQPPLQRVSQLFDDVDENFLLTFRELDCYDRPPETEYFGMWTGHIGEPPQWPAGPGRKVFGYLKPFPELPRLLHELCRLANPTLLYAPSIDPRLRKQFEGRQLRFAEEPVEMAQAAAQCDLAILNGTFANTVAVLLAGKPALHIPIFLEQATNARAVERLRAGLCAPPNNAATIVANLRCLLAIDQYAHAARRFARHYGSFDADRQAERVIDRVEELAASRSA